MQQPLPPHRPSRPSIYTDVAIIGGGLIGCLTALRLRDQGMSVMLIERGVVGAEASSAAAGILAAQQECPTPSSTFTLAIESRDRYKALAEELKQRVERDVGYRECGVVELANTDEDLEALVEKYRWQTALGHEVERWDRTRLAAEEPQISSEFAGGVYFRKDAQIDPRALTSAVLLAAVRAGVNVRTGSVVQQLLVKEGVVEGVQLDSETVVCGHVIVAAGAWSNLIVGVPLAPNSIRPARGQIVEIQTRTTVLKCVVYGAGGYVVPRADGRVLAGSTLEFVGFEKDVTVGGVLKILTTAAEILPSIRENPVGQMWANFRPYTSDGAPVIGPCGIQNLLIASGHYRSGILLAPVTARYLEELITGRTQELIAEWSPLRPALQMQLT